MPTSGNGVVRELDQTRVRSKAVHRDSIAVRREGAAQVALVGAPNAGKSSLLQALSSIQIKTGDYAFTTLRPVPAVTLIEGVLVQLVEIPGLLAGAAQGRGGGRALLGVLRSADAVVYCHDVRAPLAAFDEIRAEVAAAGIVKPSLVAVTKLDEADDAAAAVERLRGAIVDASVVGVSVLDDASLDALRGAIWDLTGLLRVYTRRHGEAAGEPIALRPGATVGDVAETLHHELAAAFRAARIWGSSARFAGQRVGREHRVADGDTVEIVA
jgi:small GTP-binding protein